MTGSALLETVQFGRLTGSAGRLLLGPPPLDLEARQPHALGAAGQVPGAAQFAAVGAQREGSLFRHGQRRRFIGIAGLAPADGGAGAQAISPAALRPAASAA